MDLVLRASARRAAVAGGEIRYVRAGQGRTLVLVHTLRTQLDYFVPLIRQLDLNRFEVLALDLPGHGHSAAPRGDYTASYFTDVVEAWLELCEVDDAIVVGDSIGATIALSAAVRPDSRIAHVVAVNPYDYGRMGGIRRSSPLANVLFTSMLWPVIGPVVARTGTRAVLRRVLEGGLHDPAALQDELVDALHESGSRPGHADAFRSLNRQWRTWIAARTSYPAVPVPVTLVYGTHDWSTAEERAANAGAIPAVRTVTIDACGHFASLERPDAVAELIEHAR